MAGGPVSAALFAALRTLSGGTLTQEQVDGINVILAAPEARGWDRRWLAYALATAWHETGAKMQPVREGFATSDDAAIRAVTDLHRRGKISRNYALRDPETGQSYYGRGLVQLTHKDNYARAGVRLGLPLADEPDLALEPDVSAAILLRGMAEGWFTGRKLPDYFNASTDNPVNARQIVNGMDKANLIAGYHHRIVGSLPNAAPPANGSPDTDLLARVEALEAQVRELIAFQRGVAAAAGSAPQTGASE